VLSALAEDPRSRYGTAAQLAEDLSRWLGGLEPKALGIRRRAI